MLRREYCRWCEEGNLLAFHHGFERRPHRHFRLAVTDVTA